MELIHLITEYNISCSLGTTSFIFCNKIFPVDNTMHS